MTGHKRGTFDLPARSSWPFGFEAKNFGSTRRKGSFRLPACRAREASWPRNIRLGRHGIGRGAPRSRPRSTAVHVNGTRSPRVEPATSKWGTEFHASPTGRLRALNKRPIFRHLPGTATQARRVQDDGRIAIARRAARPAEGCRRSHPRFRAEEKQFGGRFPEDENGKGKKKGCSPPPIKRLGRHGPGGPHSSPSPRPAGISLWMATIEIR